MTECQWEYRVLWIKRAAVSGAQDREDAGPSLANIGLRVQSACENPRPSVVPDGTWVGVCRCIVGAPPRLVLQR